MRLQTIQEEPGRRREPRYDVETAGKVTAMAEKLQARHQETLSAAEIEAIGAEVGLKPEFIRDALRQLSTPGEKAVTQPRPVRTRTHPSAEVLKGISVAWWSAGWILPVSLPPLFEEFLHRAEWGGVLFMPALGVYIGVGVFMNHLVKALASRAEPDNRPLSRQEALEVFFRLQQVLQGQKVHRAYLSVDVVGSTDLKRAGSDLEAEYSFGQYQRWVQQVVRATGGQLHSAAGDGLMAEFPDSASAVRAARALQDGLARFNVEQNRLQAPFRIRCGVSAGEVVVDPGAAIGERNSPVIDQAAALQKRAMPGDVLVSGEVAPVALTELGHLSAVPEGVNGAAAFSWRGTA